MGQGTVVWGRLIEAAARAPWWITATVGLGVAALLHLAPGIVVVLLGEENDATWGNLAALWWFPLVLCGFLAGNAFLRQLQRGRQRSSKGEGQQKRAKAKTGVPRCPHCGGPMVLRTAKRGATVGQGFWGCAAYPNCFGTMDAAERFYGCR